MEGQKMVILEITEEIYFGGFFFFSFFLSLFQSVLKGSWLTESMIATVGFILRWWATLEVVGYGVHFWKREVMGIPSGNKGDGNDGVFGYTGEESF